MEGRSNSIEREETNYLLLLNQFNGEICPLRISNTVLRELAASDNAFVVQGYCSDVVVSVSKNTLYNKQNPANILQSNQIELSKRAKR